MLVLCKMLGVFVNPLTDDYKNSPHNRDNLTQPIEILLSKKQKTFFVLLSAILKSTLNFDHFQKRDDPHSRYISQITSPKKAIR